MSILLIKDENGEFQEVPALVGSDGKTPVKGEDYWTEADISEIHNYIDSKIGEGGGGSGEPYDNDYLILISPNGTRWKLEVDNNGVLTTTKEE